MFDGYNDRGGGAYHLSSLRTLANILNELLLALLKLGTLAIQLPLRLCERALVLAQALRGRDRAAKQSLLVTQRGA